MKFYRDLFITLRESKQMTQEMLAKAIGVSQQAIQSWENGKNNPKPANVYAAAGVLCIPVSDISDLNLKGAADKEDTEIDPLLQHVLDSWPRLTPEDRGRIAGLALDLAKKSASATFDGAGA